MNDWLDSWCTTRRLHNTQVLKHAEPQRAEILPIEDTKYISMYGKKAYRKMKAEQHDRTELG